MRTYRRARIAGATCFFTVNLAVRKDNDLLVHHIDTLRAAFRDVRAAHPFHMPAIVVLPEHLHCIWELPEGDSDYPTRWRLIKTNFSRALPTGESISASRARKGERRIWQRRYWEHVIRDETDLRRHLDYIHFNPVKLGYVTRVRDWPHSSFHRHVVQGHYDIDWGGSDDTATFSFE